MSFMSTLTKKLRFKPCLLYQKGKAKKRKENFHISKYFIIKDTQ